LFVSGSTSNTHRAAAAPAPEHPKDIVQRLLWALKPIAALRKSGSVPLPYALVFLTVALEEGKPVGAYAHEMALSRYVMTRYMQCIGDKGRNDRTGLGLVTVETLDRLSHTNGSLSNGERTGAFCCCTERRQLFDEAEVIVQLSKATAASILARHSRSGSRSPA
jgi:hypothetical protein